MGLLDDIRNRVKTVTDKIPAITDEAVEKVKKTGEEGMEITKDLFGDISDKVNDITTLTRLKHDLKGTKKILEDRYLELGKIAYNHSKDKKDEGDYSRLDSEISKIEELQSRITQKTTEYDRLQKERSDSYIVKKMSDELSEAGAIIDQMVVSEKSNIAGKLLKEIVLPKQALITVVKRGAEVIIPDGNTQIQVDDLVTVSGIEEDVKKVIKRLAGGK